MSSHFRIDPATGGLEPVDYASLTEEQVLAEMKRSGHQVDVAREILAQLLPAAEAQKILTGGAVQAYEALIKLAKRAPQTLLDIL